MQPSQEPYLLACASGKLLSPLGMSELSPIHPPQGFEAGAEGALSPHLSVWFESGLVHGTLQGSKLPSVRQDSTFRRTLPLPYPEQLHGSNEINVHFKPNGQLHFSLSLILPCKLTFYQQAQTLIM